MSLLELLEEVKFKKKHPNLLKKIGDNAESNLLGSMWQGNHRDFIITDLTKKYPELYLKLIELGKLANPDFDFTGIMLNKNCVAKPHRDKNNIGNSIIVGLGDYTGGELCIVDEDEDIIYEADINKKFLEFDGKMIHYNKPIKSGTKWTIIYFKNCVCNKYNIFINRNAYPPFTDNKTKTDNQNK